jgi:hypothetical protein
MHTWKTVLSSTPARRRKNLVSKEVDFLDLRLHEYYRGNETRDDHVNLTSWKHIDLSLILVDNTTINRIYNDWCL